MMTDPASSTRRSLGSGSVFAAASVAQRALAFLLLPVYTAVLSPAEYGRLGLLITIQGGASIALAAGMEAATLRHYFQFEDGSVTQRRFVMSVWRLMVASAPSLAAVLAVALVVLAPSTDVFRPAEAAVAVLGSAAFVAATTVPVTILRAQQRLRDYLVVTLVSAVSTTTLTLLAVVVLDLGVAGWLWAFLLANLLTLGAAIFVVPWSPSVGFDSSGVRSALAMGLPLVPHAGAQWSLQLADRLVLATLVTSAALGVYTLGANIAIPALVILQSLNYGFLPAYARSSRESVGELRTTITLQVTATFVVCASLASLGAPAAAVISPDYTGASDVVPWLVLGYFFLGLYYLPMNGISLILGRTRFVWIFTVVAALASLGLIYALVPAYGLTSAAVSVSIGYGLLFVVVAVYAMSIGVRLPIAWSQIVPVAAVSALTYFLSLAASTGHDRPTQLVVRAVVLATLVVTIPAALGRDPRVVLRSARRAIRRV